MDTLQRIKNLEKNINLLETVINTLVKDNKELKHIVEELYKHNAKRLKHCHSRDEERPQVDR